MPVIASARKALRSSEAKRARNAVVKAELKRTLKNATVENIDKVVSIVDKAAKNDIIHPNKAARIKSGLAKFVAAGGEKATVKVKKKSAAAKKATAKAAMKKSVAKKAVK